jgi:hypothetical protein
MKTLALLLSVLLGVSCAKYSGATYAGGSITSEYEAITVMTDITAAKFGPRGTTIAGQNQSRVPISAIRAATTLGTASILAGTQELLSNNSTKEVLGAQQADVAKQGLKAGIDKAKIDAGVETTRILNPVVP